MKQVRYRHPTVRLSVPPMFSRDLEFDRCIVSLSRTGLLTMLPSFKSLGVIGSDGQEYPLPNRREVEEIFERNAEIIDIKVQQGFDRLQMTPLAMPALRLIGLLKHEILKHAAEGTIYRTRVSSSETPIPVRVNDEKQVWVWETLRRMMDSDSMVYFPREYSDTHGGQTKMEAAHDKRICAVPGWSVGLIEGSPVMAQPGSGRTIGGRRQLEIGLSPREYLEALRCDAYGRETGMTVEDFIIRFLAHLDATNEVSNDVGDHNATWCLGQYFRVDYAELVPTGRWHRDVGRVRLDAHRTGNKKCTKDWGATTMVRLLGV